MEVYEIDEIPKLIVDIDEDESTVNISTWEVNDDGSRDVVALDVSTATQLAENPGRWMWLGNNFTTVPTSGEHKYETLFAGVDYGQEITIKWRWIEYAEEKYGGKVYIDFNGGGTAGQGVYVGTKEIPSSNFTDALAIAARIGATGLVIKGSGTVDQSISGYIIEAWQDFRNDELDVNNQDISNCTFKLIKLTGQVNGEAWYERCYFDNVTDLCGYIDRCSSEGMSISGSLSGATLFGAATGMPGSDIDLQSGANTFAVGSVDGFIHIRNVANVGATVWLSSRGAYITIENTCTAGMIIISGDTSGITDNSGPGCIVVNTTASSQTSVDTIDGIVDAILEDTNEIQTDWTDGGRLDLLLDSIIAHLIDIKGSGWTDENLKTIDALVDAIKAQTDKMQFSGLNDIKATLDGEKVTVTSNEDKIGYSLISDYDAAKTASTQASVDAIPTNPMLDTEDGSSFDSIPDMAKESAVEGHVTNSLTNIRLDELIQNAADPATPTKNSFIDRITSKNSSQTYDRSTDSLEALRDNADEFEGDAGSSTVTITITTEGGTPIQDANVQIWNSAATALVTYGITDSNGQIQKSTEDGTFKIKVRKGGYSFDDPFDLTVSGDTSQTYTGETFIVDPPDEPELCRIYGYLVDASEAAIEDAYVHAVVFISPTVLSDGVSVISPETITSTTTSTGLFTLDLAQGIRFTITIPDIGFRKTIKVPDEIGPVTLWSLTDVHVSDDTGGDAGEDW